ncbi:hypothetical protein [Natronococcus occultus]|uniref:Uncharacterized protein n=1 Tax=Natronococcus occultus SP4 TaxID=694430 RepID=L0K5E7_9EURY|nr:hypothetical protein [Natronococcus occultus]AGB39308.1 hypothetical protein Natoc_3590 [Natronococcus occultus SP4]
MTTQVHDRTNGDGTEGSHEDALDLDGDDEAQHGQTNPSGIEFVARETLDGVECRISSNSEGLITAYLLTDGGTVLERQTIAGLDPGETFAFESRLEAGETYRIQCDAHGRSYVRGRSAVDYPFENDRFRVTNGLYTRAGAESTSYRYCIDRIGPVRETEREDAIDLDSDEEGQSWASLTDRSGVRIRTAEPVDGLVCRLSELSEGLITGYLTTDSGAVLERQTIATLEAGDTVAFETELAADEHYRVVFDARGRSYVRGRASVDYPLESETLEVTDGIYGGDERSDSYRYCIDQIWPDGAGAVVHTSESDASDDEDDGTDTLDLGSDEEGQSWSSLDEPSGVRFRTDEDVRDVTCRLSAETEGVTTAALTDDAGDVLEERSIDGLEAGETFSFETDLAADDHYRILCDADGDSYVRGRTGIGYPVASDVLEATHGIYSGDYESESYRYCVDRITVSVAESEPGEPENEEQEPEESEPTTSTVELDSDEEGQSWSSLDDLSGVRFRAHDDLERLTCRISGESDGLARAQLTDDDGGVLAEVSLDDLEAGDEFTLEADLAADDHYWILCDADGDSYVRGRASVDYPFEDDLLAVTEGIYGGYLESDSYRYCVDRITAERAGSDSESGTEIEREESELDLGGDQEAQSWSSLDRPSGVRLRAEEDVDVLECQLSGETEGVTTAVLTDDDEDVLEERSIADLEAGDAFAFETALEAGETYRVLVDADGDSYVRGRSEADYPIEDDLLAVTDGIYGGSYRSESYRYCLDRVAAEREYEVSVDDGEDDADETPDHEVATLELGDDEEGQSWSSLDDPSGVRFRTEAPVHTLECRLSAESEGLTRARLADDDGDVLAERSIADLAAGDEFVLEADLAAGETYRVVCDAEGESYVRGRTGIEYPVASDLLEATHGIYSVGYESDSYRYCVDRITAESGEMSDDADDADEPEQPALELGDDEEGQSWSSLDDRSGVRLLATESADALECRLSGETEGVTRAYLTDDDGDVLDDRSIAGLDAGETFVLNGSLEADTHYRVLCDADGESFVRGRTEIEYPIASDVLEATHGIYGGDLESDSYRYCVDRIEPTEPVESEPEPVSAPTPTESTHGLVAEVMTPPDDVTTVDVVAESSIDENGDLAAEILSYIGSQSEVNHEFVLPMGSYTWNTEFVVFDPIEYLEIRGKPRATLEIRDHGVDIAFLLGQWATNNPPKHVALRNLDVDIDDQAERDAGLISAHVGRCLIDNVELVGERWRHGPHGGDRYTCMINTRDPNALSLIRNFGLPDGEIADSSQPSVGHSIGCSADPPHEGINIWDRCYVEDYVDNGLYVRNSEGENFVDHSMAVNCGNGNIRIGAADEARDCKILLDGGSDQTYPGAGLWLNGGEAIAERIEIDGSDAQNDIVRVNSDADGGHIKDLDLFCGPNVQAPAIRCTETSSTNNRGLTIEDFDVEDITTAAGGSVRIRRSDVTLTNGTIDASYRPALTGYGDPDLEDVDMS